MRLTLASASPRRRELLAGLGIEFDALATDAEELSDGDPVEVVLENARRKARAGVRLAARPELVLGVDTDVALDGRLLGKPADASGARRRLELLSGRAHEVFSGLVVLAAAAEGGGTTVERSALARTEVVFRDLDDATIDLYLGSGEWADRAGAYAIQGLGSILVREIRGDFSNVVGLPLAALLELVPELSLHSRDKRRKL